MQAFAIDDLEGVDVLAITDGKAIQVSNYTIDDVSPSTDHATSPPESCSMDSASETQVHVVLN